MLAPYRHYIKAVLLAPLAFLFYWFLLVKNSLRYKEWGIYRANYDVYLLAQSPPSFGNRLAELLLDLGERLGSKATDWDYRNLNLTRDTLTEGAKLRYTDDKIGGFADLEAKDVESQQRGLILPVLRKAIEAAQAANKSVRVVEIGTANGDVSAKLAAEFPEGHFTGVDFSIARALERHSSAKNLTLVKGYSLDLLESGQLRGDVLFSSSTSTFFTPLELTRYLKAAKQAGFAHVVNSDPYWSFEQENNTSVTSFHLEKGMWAHNMCGYFRQAGYDIAEFKSFRYHFGIRPDLFVALVWARTA